MYFIYKYCSYDADACRLLWQKTYLVNRNIELCSMSYTPLRFGFTRADGIKVLNLVSHRANQLGYSVPMS